MSQKSTNKIKTEHEEPLSITNPFAEIHLDNLPEGSISQPDPVIADNIKTQSRGRVEVTREKAGRAGKTVTILRAFQESIPIEELDALALRLRKKCACGGSLKGRTIELQGDVCEPIMVELEKQNFRPVRCGG